jgi:hypothetical protein
VVPGGFFSEAEREEIHMGPQILATDFFMLMLTFPASVSVRWALVLPFVV